MEMLGARFAVQRGITVRFTYDANHLVDCWRSRVFRLLPVLFLAYSSTAVRPLAPWSARADGRHGQPTIDSSVVKLLLLERPVGTEQAVLRRTTTGSVLTASIRIVDRGTPLAFDAELTVASDGRPMRYRAKGRSYRFVEVDTTVELPTGTAAAFTVTGWPPVTGRALLVRYWERQGRPSVVPLLPGPAEHVARISKRGTDTVVVSGVRTVLRRFTVNGVVWGRETVWLDASDRFAAIVTRVHLLPLEGIRTDLADALPALQASAVADNMADVTAMRDVTSAGGGLIVFSGATIITGTDAPPILNGVLVVRDGRIAQVGPRGRVPVPPGARVVDVRGKTIIPGLWDMHAHASQIEWAPAYLATGVTTIRDMGGESRFLLAFRRAIDRQGAPGPRMLLAGLVDGDSSTAFGTVVASTPEQGRAVVDAYHAAGFEQMKLYTVLPPVAVRSIVDRAHAVGMTVTGHVPRALGLEGSLDAGMDQIAHLPLNGDPDAPVTRRLITRLATAGTVLDPTLPWIELLGRANGTPIERFEPGITAIAPALQANYRSVRNIADSAQVARQFAQTLRLIKALYDARVPLVAGTDGGVPGYSLLRSIELFVVAGIPPLAALQSATIDAARAMHLDQDTGTLTAGKRADLVVLDANPLEAIANIRRTRWVMSHGRLYDSAALRRLAAQ